MSKKQNLFKRFWDACRLNFNYLGELFHENPAFVIISWVTTTIQTLFPLVNIILPKLVIDAVIAGGKADHVVLLVLILFAANAAYGLFNAFISSQYLAVRGSLSCMRFLTKISRKAAELDLAQAERKETRDKMEMARNVIYRGIHNDIIQLVSGTISALAMIATTIGLLASASLWIVGAIVVTSVLCTVINFKIERDNVDLECENETIMTQLNYYEAVLQGKKFIKEIRLYNLGGWIETRCKETIERIRKNITVKNRKWSGWRAAESLVSNTMNYGAYLTYALMALTGTITLGDFTMYFQAVSSFRSNFNHVLSAFAKVLLNAEYIRAYRDFMDLNSEMITASLPAPTAIADTDAHTISFDDVSFRYVQDGPLVLEHVSLTIAPHQVYDIVGENGSGKTTFLNLLCRFYDPISGTIRLDGRPIQSIDIQTYRNHFGAIFQKFDNISFTLADNIALDHPFDISTVDALMQNVGMLDYVNTLPDRYQTYLNKDLDDDGVMLSGGQNQRIAIARAFYRNAPFLLLDEPTSALDPMAEDALIRFILSQAAGKTVFYVSHRLASVHIADKVLYIHNHTVEDLGTHKEIYARNESYRAFYDAQAKYFK